MTIIVETSGANVRRKFCANCGMFVSTMSMSLEKRLTIRPRGVVSKKDMGYRSTCDNSPVCKFLEATILPNATASVSPSTDAAETAFVQQ